MDFGLAKVVKDLASEQSIVGGTPSYMSPEQLTGSALDARTDLYSLGVVLYQSLTGQKPFSRETEEGILEKLLTTRAKSLRGLRYSVVGKFT